MAVPSGAGVALSVLGGNAGSLVNILQSSSQFSTWLAGGGGNNFPLGQVGVAISASLLPPAVNAGFFWALSLLVAATGGNVGMYGPKVFLY